jgi:hypothetical protein
MLDRVFADAQAPADFAVVHSFDDGGDDLALPFGEAVQVA